VCGLSKRDLFQQVVAVFIGERGCHPGDSTGIGRLTKDEAVDRSGEMSELVREWTELLGQARSET
jgi:hypothetical protein